MAASDSPVRNNSPDPTQYHSDIGGMPGTMIPRSGSGGQSLAFDANKPQTVIVDPGEEGGGFSLDMSQLSSSKTNFNSAAVREEVSQDPTAFFKGLSKAAAAEEQTRLKAEPSPVSEPPVKELTPMATPTPPTPPTLSALPPIAPLPTVSVAHPPTLPAALPPIAQLPDESAMEAEAEVFDTEAEIQRMLAEEASKAEALQASERARAAAAMAHDAGERTPPAVAPELTELRQHMAAQGQAINSLVAAVNHMNEKSMEPPVEQAPEPEDKAPEPELDLISGLASLKIEFLSEGGPQRPKYETYFEMPKMGTMSARYHAVIAGKDCLALIYDTRFEDGFQYLPPTLGEDEITVSVPNLEDAVYTCSSLGLHWTLGCLDIIILIRINKDEE